MNLVAVLITKVYSHAFIRHITAVIIPAGWAWTHLGHWHSQPQLEHQLKLTSDLCLLPLTFSFSDSPACIWVSDSSGVQHHRMTHRPCEATLTVCVDRANDESSYSSSGKISGSLWHIWKYTVDETILGSFVGVEAFAPLTAHTRSNPAWHTDVKKYLKCIWDATGLHHRVNTGWFYATVPWH